MKFLGRDDSIGGLGEPWVVVVVVVVVARRPPTSKPHRICIVGLNIHNGNA